MADLTHTQKLFMSIAFFKEDDYTESPNYDEFPNSPAELLEWACYTNRPEIVAWIFDNATITQEPQDQYTEELNITISIQQTVIDASSLTDPVDKLFTDKAVFNIDNFPKSPQEAEEWITKNKPEWIPIIPPKVITDDFETDILDYDDWLSSRRPEDEDELPRTTVELTFCLRATDDLEIIKLFSNKGLICGDEIKDTDEDFIHFAVRFEKFEMLDYFLSKNPSRISIIRNELDRFGKPHGKYSQ